MSRPIPLLSVVACLPLTGCFGLFLPDSDPHDGSTGTKDPADQNPTYDDVGSCYGADIPRAPENSTISVHGSAARADGTPMTGTIAMRDPATSIDVLAGILTLGLACLKEDGLDCGEWQELELDAQGKFSLTYPEEQTHGLIFDKTFDFVASAPATPSGQDGAGMVITAWFSNSEVSVPMKLWEPEVRVFRGGGNVQVSASPLIASTTCAPADEPLATFSLKDGTVVWSSVLGSFDERLLEDFDGRVTVTTSVNYIHSQVGAGLYTSAAQAFKGSAGPAPSRGAACSSGTKKFEAGKCPLTDGAWVDTNLSAGFAIVDLGADKPVSQVALRGIFQDAELSVAADGQAWSVVESGLKGSASIVALPPGTTARYLKISEPYDTESEYQPPLMARELSAW